MLNLSISGQIIEGRRGKINTSRVYFLKNKACNQVADNGYTRTCKVFFFFPPQSTKSHYSAFPVFIPIPIMEPSCWTFELKIMKPGQQLIKKGSAKLALCWWNSFTASQKAESWRFLSFCFNFQGQKRDRRFGRFSKEALFGARPLCSQY